MLNTDNRYACCEHCIDIREGCPRSDGHGSPCPFEDCASSDHTLLGEDPGDIPERVGTVIDIAQWQADQWLHKMRDDLLDHIVEIVGYEPPGVRVLLRTLSHPDVAGEAQAYFAAMDTSSRCTKYEPPWSCAKEAEAQYQNIKYGWLGAAQGVGYDESWCEPCRRKVIGVETHVDIGLENSTALMRLEE